MNTEKYIGGNSNVEASGSVSIEIPNPGSERFYFTVPNVPPKTDLIIRAVRRLVVAHTGSSSYFNLTDPKSKKNMATISCNGDALSRYLIMHFGASVERTSEEFEIQEVKYMKSYL
jgi:hypothetical protein